MVKTASVTGKPIQIKIFPQRLLQPETAERLLNEIDHVNGVIRMLIGGKNLPGRSHVDLEPEQMSTTRIWK